MTRFEQLCREILEEVKKRSVKTQKEFNLVKRELMKKYKGEKIPNNIDITLAASPKDRKKYKNILTIKPTRTLSGVAVVAIMSKPIKCPHGKCVMCPGGPASVFGDVPQSYTGKEPATRRAIRNKYDPYLQVMNRLEHYVSMNQVPDKVELIIMGGTFPSFPKKYQENFVKYALKAMNDFSKLFFKKEELDINKFKRFFELPGKINDPQRTKKIHSKLLKLKKQGAHKLEAIQKQNETAKIRCVGMTFETRPDYGFLEQGNEMLHLGATRVELGVQSVYDSALKRIERGHTTKDNIKSIQILRDIGFKLNFHVMPGIPGVSYKQDLEGLKELFKNPSYRPDMLKIYPCMVLKGTKLYQLWKTGRYKPLTTKKAIKLITEFKRYVPSYVRIMRVQRDIPTFMTAAGVDANNLRQLLQNKGVKCRCIRCREAGRASKIEKIDTLVHKYQAGNGTEFFISAEDVKNNVLLGFCRMRFPYQSLRKEITKKSALIRELHVYGSAAAIGKKGTIQHKGYGKKLLKTAENIAKQQGKDKMIVISGIGAREYYRKLGYKKQGPYMVKLLL